MITKDLSCIVRMFAEPSVSESEFESQQQY